MRKYYDFLFVMTTLCYLGAASNKSIHSVKDALIFGTVCAGSVWTFVLLRVGWNNRRTLLTIANEKLWGRISMILILAYVTIGGGYEIVSGIRDHHIQSSLPFASLSCSIFVGRIFYAVASGARRTLWADIYGAVVMAVISILHLYFN